MLTVSATRVNEIQEFVVLFTGDTTDDGGTVMSADATANALIDLTFDSANMNWACSDSTETTSSVRFRDRTYFRRQTNSYDCVPCATCRRCAHLLMLPLSCFITSNARDSQPSRLSKASACYFFWERVGIVPTKSSAPPRVRGGGIFPLLGLDSV